MKQENWFAARFMYK